MIQLIRKLPFFEVLVEADEGLQLPLFEMFLQNGLVDKQFHHVLSPKNRIGNMVFSVKISTLGSRDCLATSFQQRK